jgi:methylthioribulose-1-phosphate dehydratase
MDAPAGPAATVPNWAAEAIVEAGRRMYAQGLAQATSGNISVRVDAERIALTRSGTHKGFLDAGSVMLVDLAGRPCSPGRPSAETALHCQIYRLLPETGAVVHAHSVAGTVLSMAQRGPIRFAGYELIKAFAGQPTHDVSVALPVFDNDQNIPRLAQVVEPVLLAGEAPLGYMIAGHGAYVWAADMPRALTHLEALEFLLACELEKRKVLR